MPVDGGLPAQFLVEGSPLTVEIRVHVALWVAVHWKASISWDMEGAEGNESENSCVQRKEGEDQWPKYPDTEGMLYH